jgi:hypothetical protein
MEFTDETILLEGDIPQGFDYSPAETTIAPIIAVALIGAGAHIAVAVINKM